MKYITLGLFWIFLIVFCNGCGVHDNCGYPDKLTFPAEGGELTITGDRMFSVSLHTFSGDEGELNYSPTGDTIYHKLDWLYVRSTVRAPEILVRADTNYSGRKRTLYIHLFSPGTVGSIKVTQIK